MNEMFHPIFAAMSFGPPVELIFLFFVVVFIMGLFLLLLLLKIIFCYISWIRIVKTILLVPITIGLVFITWKFCTKPMKVTRFRLQGSYVINRDIIKGEDADWQYEHYWIRIKGDTLYLNVMENGKRIKQYRKHITYDTRNKHTFFRFSNHPGHVSEDKGYTCYYSMNDSQKIAYYEPVYTSGNHPMLIRQPKLHADPFLFNVVLYSGKYQNMFFTKGKWKNPRKR